jgi:hypothetical protein
VTIVYAISAVSVKPIDQQYAPAAATDSKPWKIKTVGSWVLNLRQWQVVAIGATSDGATSDGATRESFVPDMEVLSKRLRLRLVEGGDSDAWLAQLDFSAGAEAEDRLLGSRQAPLMITSPIQTGRTRERLTISAISARTIQALVRGVSARRKLRMPTCLSLPSYLSLPIDWRVLVLDDVSTEREQGGRCKRRQEGRCFGRSNGEWREARARQYLRRKDSKPMLKLDSNFGEAGGNDCVEIDFAYLRLLSCRDGASHRLFDKLATEQTIFKAKESKPVSKPVVAIVPNTDAPVISGTLTKAKERSEAGISTWSARLFRVRKLV